MDAFDHLLKWTLKRGSHVFPGPDGGTCINEAAIVAAGFPYQRVTTPTNMPYCFSRPICGLAMVLNDQAPDDERQRLLPFVTRLACADTPQVERVRSEYISRRMEWFRLAPRLDGLYLMAAITLLSCERPSAWFNKGLEVLEGALAIGRQADPFPADEVHARLEAVTSEAAERGSVPALPLLSKVKEWFVAGSGA
jgi:hypothetical protein